MGGWQRGTESEEPHRERKGGRLEGESRTTSGFDYSDGEVQARRGDTAAFISGTFGDSVIDLYFPPPSSLNCLPCSGLVYISRLGNNLLFSLAFASIYLPHYSGLFKPREDVIL